MDTWETNEQKWVSDKTITQIAFNFCDSHSLYSQQNVTGVLKVQKKTIVGWLGWASYLKVYHTQIEGQCSSEAEQELKEMSPDVSENEKSSLLNVHIYNKTIIVFG